ncbi:MAG TPA: hypothetical protein VKJ83_00035 [Actinomycetota bacterium]|nr:hypothetical protein [Actinomycetota bacterium]
MVIRTANHEGPISNETCVGAGVVLEAGLDAGLDAGIVEAGSGRGEPHAALRTTGPINAATRRLKRMGDQSPACS